MKPHKVDVNNEVNGRQFAGSFESKAEADAWIAKQVAKQSWGKNQRNINAEDMSPELVSRIISTTVVAATEDQPEQTIHTVKADYVITQSNQNLSKNFRNEKKLQDRKKEYPSMDEVLHIILDKGMDSQEYLDMQAQRAAVKAKYPLEP